VIEHIDVAPLGFVEGWFGGRHREVMGMVLSFRVTYAAVAMVTRFSVLVALFGNCERDCEHLDSSDNWTHNLLNTVHLNLSRRDPKTVYVQSTICVHVCTT